MADQNQKGIILKQAREAKGLSIRTVHEDTKIPMDVLRAIEEGYTIRTLSSFYHKGFLKMYARYLGLDARTVVDDYKEEKPQEAVKEKKEEDVQFRLEDIFTPDRLQAFVKILIVIGVLFMLVKIVGCLSKKIRGGAKGTVADTTKQKSVDSKRKERSKSRLADAQKETAKKTADVKKPAVSVSTSISAPAETIVKKINLSVRAKRSGWLQVKVDGDVVFQSVFKRGAVETWLADKSIEIAGKNIHELEFELNGKVIGLGRRNRQTRKVIITKNGLSVR